MAINYQEFLSSKRLTIKPRGISIEKDQINPVLFPFQKDIVKWGVKKGKCAVFLDTGLGKTFIQIEWARLIGKKTLIVAPLSVAKQTIREGKKIEVEIKYVRHQEETIEGINITNYEMIDEFDDSFGAIVLDESSILKSLGGKTLGKMTGSFLKEEGDRVITEIVRTMPVGPGGI